MFQGGETFIQAKDGGESYHDSGETCVITQPLLSAFALLGSVNVQCLCFPGYWGMRACGYSWASLILNIAPP